jgi:hypothetical protein
MGEIESLLGIIPGRWAKELGARRMSEAARIDDGEGVDDGRSGEVDGRGEMSMVMVVLVTILAATSSTTLVLPLVLSRRSSVVASTLLGWLLLMLLLLVELGVRLFVLYSAQLLNLLVLTAAIISLFPAEDGGFFDASGGQHLFIHCDNLCDGVHQGWEFGEQDHCLDLDGDFKIGLLEASEVSIDFVERRSGVLFGRDGGIQHHFEFSIGGGDALGAILCRERIPEGFCRDEGIMFDADAFLNTKDEVS